MPRVNPDEIDFSYRDGTVYYHEAVHDRDLSPYQIPVVEARKDVQFALTRMQEDPSIEVVDMEFEVDDGTTHLYLEMKQDAVQSVAALMKELMGWVMEEDPSLFARKALPMFERFEQEHVDDILEGEA